MHVKDVRSPPWQKGPFPDRIDRIATRMGHPAPGGGGDAALPGVLTGRVVSDRLTGPITGTAPGGGGGGGALGGVARAGCGGVKSVEVPVPVPGSGAGQRRAHGPRRRGGRR